MSHIDSRDNYDFPPGLGFAPRPGSNIYNYHQSSVTPLGEFPPVDRRSLSMAHGAFPPLHSSMPRSIGGHDQEYGIFGNGGESAPTNRATPAVTNSLIQTQRLSSASHQQLSPSGVPANNYYSSPSYNDRDGHDLRNATSPSPPANQLFLNQSALLAAPAASSNTTISRSTLYWGDLEPWMDEDNGRHGRY